MISHVYVISHVLVLQLHMLNAATLRLKSIGTWYVASRLVQLVGSVRNDSAAVMATNTRENIHGV